MWALLDRPRTFAGLSGSRTMTDGRVRMVLKHHTQSISYRHWLAQSMPKRGGRQMPVPQTIAAHLRVGYHGRAVRYPGLRAICVSGLSSEYGTGRAGRSFGSGRPKPFRRTLLGRRPMNGA